MKVRKQDKRVSALLALWLATLFILTQIQLGGHFHGEGEANIAHECTVCVAVSHLDDVDKEEDYFPEERQSTESPVTVILHHFSSLFLASFKTRAPPVS